MADNIDVTPGTGKTIAADDIGGVLHQQVKIEYGADNTATPVSSANPLPVVQTGTPALPTGAATDAKLDTIISAVDGIEGYIDGIESSLSTISGNVDQLEGYVDTVETLLTTQNDTLIVDDAAFTPATTKVQMAGFTFDDVASDSVNEGDAGAARMSANRNQYVQIRDNAGNERGLNIDANGALAATVTNSTATNLKTQAEAYQGGSAVAAGNPLQVTLANGSVPSHAVTNAGTFAIQDSEKIVDNTEFTDGHTKVLPTGYIYDEVAGTALTENDIAAARINVNRALVNVIEDGSTRGRYATVTAANAVKVDASGVAVPITDNSSSLTVDAPVATPVFVRLSDGAAAITTLPVSLSSVPSHAVTNAGTFAVQAAGDVAHDSVDSGSPVKVGGQARTTNPTAVADADRSNFITDKLGKQVVVGSIRDLKGEQVTTITSSTTETTIVTAVASTFLDLYGLILANTSATATKVTIRDATAGGTARVFYVPAGDTRGFMLPESAALKQGTVNNNWTATCGSSVASLEVTALYVKNI